MGNYITLKGFDEFEKKIADLPQELIEEVDEEVLQAAQQWAKLAKVAAPTGVSGELKAEISFEATSEKGTWEVVSPKAYSAYMEWGTRTRVSVPGELAAYAATFKGGGDSKGDVKEMIYEWCRLKGIPEKDWFWIFMKIMKVGVNPQPFFFVQMPIVEKELFGRIKVILETEH